MVPGISKRGRVLSVAETRHIAGLRAYLIGSVLRWSVRSFAAALFCVGSFAASAQVQFPIRQRFPKKPPVVRPNAGGGRAALGRPDPEAVMLLRQMLHPLVDYAAEEQTWIAQGGGMTSSQTIKGDTKGNVIRNYVTPEFLHGDAMVTGPNRYFYFHSKSRTLTEVPPAGGQEDERDRNIVDGIKNRTFVARRTGNETVAGINATIVLVSPTNPQQQGYAKFWIDPATHIKLKIEIANAANSKISTSELSSLVTGAGANVLPRDFQAAQFRTGAPNELKRQKVASIQEAMQQIPFHPLVPGNLPAGYRLAGVQVLNGPVRVGIFLRYTDGVGFFTISEHRVRQGQRIGAARADAEAPHWYVPMANYDIDVVYRGHLPPQQEQMIHDSLQPVP
jgi:hypothetical protein